MSSIPLVNLKAMHDELRSEIDAAIGKVIDGNGFCLGPGVESFEQAFAAYLGVKHCIGVGSGLDALTLMLKGSGIGPGDEVIIQGNTFVATALAIHHAGATPVLVDHDPDTYNLDPRRLSQAITSRTKAILPVHLYGQPADMDAIHVIAQEHGLLVLEDAGQAHGAMYKGRHCGSLGGAAAFSFYPGKNLGAMGDGGAIVTDDDELAEWARAARNYGSLEKHHHAIRGYNTRLDAMQAAVLHVKLKRLDEWNRARRIRAALYDDLLSSIGLHTPVVRANVEHVYHLYVIQCPERDRVLASLNERGIGAGIHYPHAIATQPAFQHGCMVPQPLTNTDAFCDRILSLPICPYITEEQVLEVAEALRTLVGEPQGAVID